MQEIALTCGVPKSVDSGTGTRCQLSRVKWRVSTVGGSDAKQGLWYTDLYSVRNHNMFLRRRLRDAPANHWRESEILRVLLDPHETGDQVQLAN